VVAFSVGVRWIPICHLGAREELEDSKKGRAELDYPDDAADAFEEVSQLLDEWEPDEESESEDDFTRDLAEYLDDNSDWKAEVYPKTREAVPIF
jgi:methionyl-tRNA synthetase